MKSSDSIKIVDYINEQINRLVHRKPVIPPFKKKETFIVSALLRATYRTHSITQSYEEHVKNVVAKSILNNSPIPIVCPYGGYKLWKLPIAPYAEWSELFFLMHKVNWLKPILEIYEPGVTFDFFSDGVIIPTLNGISEQEVVAYETSLKELVNTLQMFIPSNLKFTFHNMLDLYPSKEVVLFEVNENYRELLMQERFEPHKFSEQEKKSALSNTKKSINNEKELHDLLLLHEAYALCSRRRPYYRNREKIFVGFSPVTEALTLRSTRTSSLRFWLGTGYLMNHDSEDKYIEGIMSPLKRQNTVIKRVPITIDSLSKLPNFDVIDFLE